MSGSDFKTSWKSCQKALKEKLNRYNYESWIEPIDFVESNGSQIVLSAPSTFYVDWIKDRYLNLIEAYLCAGRAEGSLQVKFITRERAPESPDIVSEHSETTLKTSSEASLSPSGSARAPTRKSNLNDRYSFDNFVVGKSNEFCHACSRAIVTRLGQVYNPLFIYGGVGLGKTHIMQAIGNEAFKRDKNLSVLYVSSEKFVNDLINAIQRASMSAFRKRYRSLDLLLIDDIQFIAGKERTQEEFFHTFNALHEARKQIVISSDKFPKEITNLEERLRSRFAWGLISDIQPPELETKIAIARNIAKRNSFELDDEVAAFLATRVRSNIRELEGVLSRVMAYASLAGKPLTLEMARATLKGIYDDANRALDIRKVQKVVAEHFDLRALDLKGRSRRRNVTLARQIAIYLCREHTDLSLPEIGAEFGGRDHSTVIHSVNKIKNSIERETSLYNKISLIQRELDI